MGWSFCLEKELRFLLQKWNQPAAANRMKSTFTWLYWGCDTVPFGDSEIARI